MSDRSLDGWLHKLAKPKRTSGAGAAPAPPNWQRRWFTLLGDTLSFYNTEQDAAQKVPPKWTLDLGAAGAAVAPFSEPGAPPDPTRIELSTAGERSLRAESEFEAEMWMSALVTPARGGGGVPALPTPAAAMPAVIANPMAAASTAASAGGSRPLRRHGHGDDGRLGHSGDRASPTRRWRHLGV